MLGMRPQIKSDCQPTTIDKDWIILNRPQNKKAVEDLSPTAFVLINV
jgi:hypothetical protein